MATRRFYQPPPTADALVDTTRKINLKWLAWVNYVAQRLGILTEITQTYDPPNIASGATSSVAVTFAGARAGDKAWATHSAVVSGVVLLATATTDSVTVTFWNVSAGALDIASGTLRVGVESTT